MSRTADTKRWGGRGKVLGGHNGKVHDRSWEDMTPKVERRVAKKEVKLELAEAGKMNQRATRESFNSLGVPGFTPGQAFSSEWLIRQN